MCASLSATVDKPVRAIFVNHANRERLINLIIGPRLLQGSLVALAARGFFFLSDDLEALR